MVVKANKLVVIESIIKEIEKGTDRAHVISIYCKKFQKTARTIDTYWKIAKEQHSARQQAIQKEIAAVDTQAAIYARKSGLKSKQDRLMLLQKEADNCIRDLRKPKATIWDKIALRRCFKDLQAEISKIQGDYAPTKLANTNKEGDDVPAAIPMTTTQVTEIIKALRETATS